MYAELKDETLRYRGCSIRDRQTNPSSIPHRPDTASGKLLLLLKKKKQQKPAFSKSKILNY